ncbi:MAG: hypothetical protein K0V04_14285 [Deltaproteobacteria bacterium]|nr:hypothetical protein [Deltaproteobacteria bacterium]
MNDRVEDNAVMRRLAWLRRQYEDFAARPRARLLRWRLADDERRMLDAFVVTENDARLGQLPDLFVPMVSAFESSREHGATLRHELAEQYEHAFEAGVEDEAIGSRWSPPPVTDSLDDLDVLVTTATSLVEHHEAIMEHLVLVLQPRAVADAEGWVQWLRRLAERLPERVRVIVPDALGDSPLDSLVEPGSAQAVSIVEQRAELDMHGAYLELSKGKADDVSPASEVRRSFVRMVLAGQQGDVEAAIDIGTPAVRTAEQQGWWDLAATLQIAMGALYDADAQPDAARERFSRAESSAARAGDQGDPAASQLRIQARMSEASALLRMEQWDEAARAYQDAAGLAEAEGNLLAAHDGWRLASHAHTQACRQDEAWRCGARALRAGEQLAPAQRRLTTLPYTGRALLQLAEADAPPPDVDLPRATLMQRLDGVLGEGWRAST